MTIANKFAGTVASAESIAADLKTFALETQNEQAKQMFQQLSQSMDNTVSQLRNRLTSIMQEEPQYANELQPMFDSTMNATQNSSSTKDNTQQKPNPSI